MTRILVAENDEPTRRLIRLCLEARGHVVVETQDAGEAVARLASGAQVDLFLTDQRMPGVSGLEAIERAQEIDPGLPCLLVSGLPDVERELAGRATARVGFLRKPFRARDLAQAVSDVIEGTRVLQGRAQEPRPRR